MKYVNQREAAKLVNRSVRTINRWRKKGILPYKQFPPNTGKVSILVTDLPTNLRKI